MSLICYGIALIGTISLAIVVYIMSLLGYHIWLSHLRSTMPVEENSHGPSAPCLVSTFKYNKGIENADATVATECVVCLSGFEDEEYVRQLPRCKHSFHAPCIDMWLYSHSDCPLCRAPVDRLDSHRGESTKGESSRDVLLEISISS